ncbi:MAG TPA: tetratricopeptide repeat protein, partial [Polyangiaceae bacterium]|nr:tetratricopeptide repeat protein [Polyangiaceae bacterium]
AQLAPGSFAVQHGLAGALAQRGQHEAAVEPFRAALALEPRSLPALLGLMGVLEALKQLDAVEVVGQRILALDPGAAAAHRALGLAYQGLGRIDDAIASLQRALELDPTEVQTHYYLGYAWMRLGRIEEAVASFRHAVSADPKNAAAQSALIVALLIHPEPAPADVQAELRTWAQRHAEPLYPSALPCARDRSPERPLRVGYVSPDFCDHSLRFFMLPLLEQHDRSQFDIVCYSNVARPDAWTGRLQALARNWRDVSMLDDASFERLVRADGIDILVDLSLHAPRNRLQVFARKPAPVQLSWLGYPGTTGMRALDYYVTDPFLEPLIEPPAPAAPAPLHLPHTFWCYASLSEEPTGPLPALAAGHLTFGNLNDLCKVHRDVLALWARVLLQVERSCLLLLAPNGSARERIRDTLSSLGVQPERVDFVERLERSAYLRCYQRLDLCLDCFPYNGHTTGLDAWWMGVPVVTLVGRSPVARAGLSQARNLRLDEFTAATPEEFVHIAVRACQDLPRLSALRRSLRARMQASPLMDAPRFARDLEHAYRTVWRKWCQTTAASTG